MDVNPFPLTVSLSRRTMSCSYNKLCVNFPLSQHIEIFVGVPCILNFFYKEPPYKQLALEASKHKAPFGAILMYTLFIGKWSIRK